MPTNQNDVIRGPYRAAVDALAGDDLLYWTHTSGNATLRGGSTGEHYDTNPYNAGNPGGDRLYLPVENIELLSRYGSDSAEAQLDRLGGGQTDRPTGRRRAQRGGSERRWAAHSAASPNRPSRTSAALTPSSWRRRKCTG